MTVEYCNGFFSKSAKKLNKIELAICNLIYRNCFQLMRDCKRENLGCGGEISAVPFRTKKRGVAL